VVRIVTLVKRARHLGGAVFPALSAEQRDPTSDFVRAGLFDLPYYRAQLPEAERPRSLSEARRHYIATGRAAGLSIHPFIEPEWWDPHANTDDEDHLGRERWLIHGGQRGSSTSPLIADPVGSIGATRDYLKDLLEGRVQARIPGGLTATAAVQQMTRAVDRGLRRTPNAGTASNVDWAAVRKGLSERVPGRTSVLVPTFEDWRMTVESVRASLAEPVEGDIEVIVVDNGSRLAVFRSLTAVFLGEPRVRLVRCSVNTNFAGGMNRAIAESTGEYIVLLNNDAVLSPGWRAPLIAALDDMTVRGAQPLLLYPATNRVQAAGTMFLGEGVLPWHFLAGHPRDDADRMTNLSFRAVTAAVMVMRAADLVDASGFDEEFENGYEDVDLCLRMLRDPRDRFLLVRESIAVHPEGSSAGRSARDSENRVRFFRRWAGRMPSPEPERYLDIGMRLSRMRPLWYSPEVPIVVTDPQVERERPVVGEGPATGRPSLRWMLLTGDADRAVVEQTRAALLDLGQECVEVHGGAHWSDVLADVVVGFSGAGPTFPRAGAFNVSVSPGPGDEHAQTVTDGSTTDLLRVIAEMETWEKTVFPGAES